MKVPKSINRKVFLVLSSQHNSSRVAKTRPSKSGIQSGSSDIRAFLSFLKHWV
jgi:hypothetical protein